MKLNNKRSIQTAISIVLTFCIVGLTLIGAFGASTVLTSADGKYLYQVLSNGTVSICSGTNAKAYLGNETVVNVPETIDGYIVTKIGVRAFNGCASIKEISLPDSVTGIDSYAFISCSSLETVKLNEGLKSLAYGAFLNCTKLTAVELPDTVTSIGTYGFKGCTSLTSIVIPTSMTAIGNSVFNSCTSLESIVIPASVKSINSNAFDNCISFTTVYGYYGTYAETFANDNGYIFIDLDVINRNKITVDSAEVVSGNEVTVAVKIANNTGFAGAEIDISYDAQMLEAVEVLESNEVLSNGILEDTVGVSGEGLIKVIWSGNTDCQGDGVLFYVKFLALENALGDAEISLSYDQLNTFDENIQDVVFNCAGGTVRVIGNSADTPVITLNGSGVVRGESFSVYGVINSYRSTKAISIAISFDDSSFEFVSVTADNGAIIGSVANAQGTLSFTVNGINSGANGKTIFLLNFRCKENAEKGSYEFSGQSDEALFKNAEIKVTASSSGHSAKVYSKDVLAKAGTDTVCVPVYISENDGIMGFRISIAYDPEVLRPSSVEGKIGKGNLQDNIGVHPGSVDIIWNYSEDDFFEGEMLLIEFEVLTNSFTVTDINISYSQDDTFNESYEDVTLLCTGSEAAINAVEGDIDLNGSVEQNDYSLFREYLSGTYEFNDIQLLIADMDGDTAADAFDMFYLNRKING